MQTPLDHQVEAGQRRPDPVTALTVACAWFEQGRRLEMGPLAEEVGVSRATLFRWVGSRDELLGEVIWSLAAGALERADLAETGPRDADRIAAVLGRFAASAAETPAFTDFVAKEPDRALRILTARTGVFQVRLVAAVEDLLVREGIAEGATEGARSITSRDLAALAVDVAQGLIHADVISGQAPDPIRIRHAIRRILQDPQPAEVDPDRSSPPGSPADPIRPRPGSDPGSPR
jgi:AcrR family transcriptional regulator